METVLISLKEANRRFKSADHMLFMTYPLLKDTKLLILIAENLYQASILALDALLKYELMFRRVSSIPVNFNEKMDILKREVAIRYNIDRSNIVNIEDMNTLIEARRKSPIEFCKRDKYVICSDDYKTNFLTIDKLKNYLNESKVFINRVNSIIENARRFSTI